MLPNGIIFDGLALEIKAAKLFTLIEGPASDLVVVTAFPNLALPLISVPAITPPACVATILDLYFTIVIIVRRPLGRAGGGARSGRRIRGRRTVVVVTVVPRCESGVDGDRESEK